MGQVEGKVAIVTAGASRIGAACAATLAREGAKVVITDIDDAGAQAVAGRIVAAGGEAILGRAQPFPPHHVSSNPGCGWSRGRTDDVLSLPTLSGNIKRVRHGC
jgi:NAD(P)-dependent dehydrogenase (short-subunit alcohol dehydrogenase family)